MDRLLLVLSDQFTNREVAMAIWFAVLSAWLMRRDASLRRALGRVVEVFFNRAILTVYLLCVIYISTIVFGFHQAGLWNTYDHLKVTIFWAISVAFVTVMSIGNASKDRGFFRAVVMNAVKVTILLEFVVQMHTFSLPVELILVPISAALVMAIAFSESNDEPKTLGKAATVLLALLSLAIILRSVRGILADVDDIFNIETLIEMLLPSMLTILFVPFAYLLALALAYDEVFHRLKHRNTDSDLVGFAWRRVVLRFGVNYRALLDWSRKHPDMKVGDKGDVVRLLGK